MPYEGKDLYWFKIKRDDLNGWVYGAYIDLFDVQYKDINKTVIFLQKNL
jgi:hypothetical protein